MLSKILQGLRTTLEETGVALRRVMGAARRAPAAPRSRLVIERVYPASVSALMPPAPYPRYRLGPNDQTMKYARVRRDD